MARADRHKGRKKKSRGGLILLLAAIVIVALAVTVIRPLIGKRGRKGAGSGASSAQTDQTSSQTAGSGSTVASSTGASASSGSSGTAGEQAPDAKQPSGWRVLYEDPLDIPADIADTEALKARAAAMQNYDHAPGEDAEPISKVDDNILLLVNKTHPLSADYKADDMVKVTRIVTGIGSDETHQMRALAAEHLNEMFDAAKADGYDIRLRTGYRSYSYQKSLFDSYANNHGKEAANRYSALPGESEHQTGWCCDVGMEGVSLSGFTGTKAAQWIVDHAHEYGFILRYPEEKEDVTGYIYESWHIRYVGIEAAAEIHEQGITLEEFLGVLD